MTLPRCSRRELFALVGATAAGCALAACGSANGPARRGGGASDDVLRFRSRPDLRPPAVQVTGDVPGGGHVFITPGGPMIVDAGGALVWSRPSPGEASMNLQVQRYRGEPVLTWWQGTIRNGVGDVGAVIVLDPRYREVTRVKAARGLRTDFHEFVLAPDGTGYLTAYREVTADLTAVGGPRRGRMLDAWIQGIDVGSGKVVFEWRSADHIDLAESYRTYSGSPFTPVHLNSIEPLPDGNLLVSARHTWTVYKVDRSSGEILWRLGGKKNDFTFGTGVSFAWQHDARWHAGDVLSMFDNESAPPEASQSRGLVLHVTEPARFVTFRHAYYYPGEQLLSGSQGSVQFMGNGDVFVGWGSQPYFTQYRHDGKAVLSGTLEKGTSYRAFRSPWAGTPDGRPAIAVERRGGDALRVYASWNGATQVARWSVLGGRAAGELTELVVATRSGFETVIDVPAARGVRFVAARAVDGRGNVLSTSAVVGA